MSPTLIRRPISQPGPEMILGKYPVWKDGVVSRGPQEKVENHDGPFRYLKLPQEVRDMILVNYFDPQVANFWVIGDRSYRIEAEDKIELHPNRVRSLASSGGQSVTIGIISLCALQLFLVSKKLHREASEVYYRHKVFHFQNANALRHILCGTTLRCMDRIRTIHVDFHGPGAGAAAWRLSRYRSLKKLKLTLFSHTILQQDAMRFPGKKHLLELRGVKNLELVCKTDNVVRWDDFNTVMQITKIP